MPPDLVNVSASSPARGKGQPPFPNAYRSGGCSVFLLFSSLPAVVNSSGFYADFSLTPICSPNPRQAPSGRLPAVLSPICSLAQNGKNEKPKTNFKAICETFSGEVVDCIKKFLSLSQILKNASIMERKQKAGKWISLIIDLLKVLAGYLVGVNV